MGSQTSRYLRAFGEEKSLKEWKLDSRCLVCSSAVDRRLRRGWALEQALSTPPNDGARRRAFGDRKTLGEWAMDPRCVVPERTLSGRIARGEGLEEALTRPQWKFASTRSRTGKRWSAFGKLLTANQWAEDPRCVVPLNVLRMRLIKGMNPEAALTTPVGKHEREFNAFGETKSLAAWSRDSRCVIPYGTLTQRIDRGWDIVDALSVPLKSKGSPGRRANKTWRPVLPSGDAELLEAFGERKTLRQWAEDPRCQVPYLRLRTRLKRNWALENAIAVVPAVGNRNVEAFGDSKSLYAWEKDPRCLVTRKTLRYRMAHGESLEEAMIRPSQNERIRSFWIATSGSSLADAVAQHEMLGGVLPLSAGSFPPKGQLGVVCDDARAVKDAEGAPYHP